MFIDVHLQHACSIGTCGKFTHIIADRKGMGGMYPLNIPPPGLNKGGFIYMYIYEQNIVWLVGVPHLE